MNLGERNIIKLQISAAQRWSRTGERVQRRPEEESSQEEPAHLKITKAWVTRKALSLVDYL